MIQYLHLVKYVLTQGQWKINRTGIRTVAAPNMSIEHNMDDGFPLLTTKKMAYKSMAVELEGFINGITSKKWYQDRKCNIWNEWANPIVIPKTKMVDLTEEELKSRPEDSNYNVKLKEYTKDEIRKLQRDEDDLGPIYGYQWRRFGEAYDEDDTGQIEGYDQLKEIINTLEINPDDRRMVCSAWNPHHLTRQALPPCHLMWGLMHLNGVLNLWWVQRSCDLMLGVPFNLASYSLLLKILCNQFGFKPGKVTGLLVDCHIYENQIPGAQIQLERQPKSLPQLNITHESKNIFDWTHKDIELINYNSDDKIDFGQIAI